MYCPNCGQQQISDEMRFCSRCGFTLAPVAQLLKGGELLLARDEEPRRKFSMRHNKGARRGAKLLFFSVVIIPIAIGMAVITDSPGPAILPFTLFLAGLFQLIYVAIFGDTPLPEKSAHKTGVIQGAGQARPVLPSAENAPPTLIDSPPAHTAEIVQPPSVTERTTTLLEKK